MASTEKFKIELKEDSGVHCLYLDGYLDAHTAPVLEEAIESCINRGINNILISFKDLDYISSAGLGVFMAYIEDIRNNGGDLKLANMKPKVFSVFDLLGFPILFDILEEEEIAIKKFNNLGEPKDE